MNISPIISAVSSLLWFIPLFILIAILKTPWFKGIMGEFLVRSSGKLRLPRDTYQAIHDVTIHAEDGTTQIDHLYVSRFGLFVVETKNMKGWIFGNANQPQWTQKLYGKSYKFQNPLRQNYKHVKALQSLLELPDEAIYSVVVFAGEAVLKTPMPDNVVAGGKFVDYIKSFDRTVLSDEQVRQVIKKVEIERLAPSFATNREHVAQLRKRHAHRP